MYAVVLYLEEDTVGVVPMSWIEKGDKVKYIFFQQYYFITVKLVHFML